MTNSALDSLVEALNGMKSGSTLAQQIASFAKIFKPYKPEVRSFRIDYLNRNSEMKYLLEIPSGITRKTMRRIQVPARFGFTVYDIINMDTGELVNVDYNREERQWTFNLSEFPEGEKFLLTTKGAVAPDFIGRLVDLKAATNPKRSGGKDKYWIHAAIKDVSILERVWDELNIDRVNVDVRIGVERFFTSQIPSRVKKNLELQRELLEAIKRGERNIEKLKLRYRRSSLEGTVTPAQIVELTRKLVSGEFFTDYIHIDRPFILGDVESERDFTSMVPERVKIAALSNLNLKLPAAKGDLVFNRSEYTDCICNEISEILPKKKKRSR